MENKPAIEVNALVDASVEKTWKYWTEPQHIKQWNHASDDWHTTHAANDLRVGGKFSSRMEAKDQSFGFDFGGTYDAVKVNELIEYTMGDGRKVHITFSGKDGKTLIVEKFEPETTNPVEMQQQGWQAILNNFKKYTENRDPESAIL